MKTNDKTKIEKHKEEEKEQRRQELKERLQQKLKELFQFEEKDLDFGIYRIMNIKRDEIEKFIEEELFAEIEARIKTYTDASSLSQELIDLKSEIEEKFKCSLKEAKEKQPDQTAVKNYIKKEKQIIEAEEEEIVEEQIYDDILNFFSRYYSEGDFISKRRYSKENKYAIPYNGEEVYLYWANHDQYYIKTTEQFNHYRFKIGDLKVVFEIQNEEIEVEQSNIKGKDKYFIFSDSNYDAEEEILTVKFGYRPLTDEEKEEALKVYNQRYRDSGNTLSSFQKGKTIMQGYNAVQIYDNNMFINNLLQENHKLKNGELSDKSELEWHLHKYTTKNTKDYFIHKNLDKFLKRELDFFIKNELLHVDDITSGRDLEINVNRIRVFKEIARKIIGFLAQIEDFQKKLWEKKKFVVSTDYLITLDYIDDEFYSSIIQNEKQLKEWKDLYSFDLEAEAEALKDDLTGHNKDEDERKIEVLKQNLTLCLDTKFFGEEFKYEILGGIDNLDERTNGILIKSENFQALNLLLNKYKERVKCCYIDPPYNTGNDDFLYKDGFNHSSWISMIYDRVNLSKHLLKPEGFFLSSIDDTEISNLKKILNKVFDEHNYIDIFSWVRTETPARLSKKSLKNVEYILGFQKSKSLKRLYGFKTKSVSSNTLLNQTNKVKTIIFPPNIVDTGIKDKILKRGVYGTDNYKIILEEDTEIKGGIFIKPVKITAKFRWSQGKLDEEIENGTKVSIRTEKLSPSYEKQEYDTSPPKNLINREVGVLTNEIARANFSKFGNLPFSYPKPVSLISYLIKFSQKSEITVMDFFAGSGTTGHATLKLNKEDEGNRKFILVEMGEYFDTVLKPRIAKVIYSENWKDGKPQDKDGSTQQIIKYQSLEQYEDTLNNIDFTEANDTAQNTSDYNIKYMLEFESRDSRVFLNLDELANPFAYKLKIEKDNEIQEKVIDLVETFNYIAGIKVDSINKKTEEDLDYVFVRGTRKDKKVIVIWRNKAENFSAEKDREYLQNEIEEDYDEIFMNGCPTLNEAKSIDEEFKNKIIGD